MAPKAYRASNPFAPYFVTYSVNGWIDVFTRSEYCEIIVQSFKHCIAAKGLELNAWIIMSSHVHFIGRAIGTTPLADIIRDIKKFTSKTILKAIYEGEESRKEWLTSKFRFYASQSSRGDQHLFWQSGYHAVLLDDTHTLTQSLDYLHQNPVKAGMVINPEAYRYSSAIDYIGGQGLIPLSLI